MRNFSRRAVTSLAVLLFFGPVNAWAQTIDFQDLARVIKPGDTVSVTDAAGLRIKGTIESLTPSSLTLLRDGRRSSVPGTAVMTVTVRDSVMNGFLGGLAVGALPGVLLGLSYMNGCGDGGPDCPEAVLVFGGITGGVGALIGGTVDALLPTTIRVGHRSAIVAVSPIVGQTRRGFTLSVRF